MEHEEKISKKALDKKFIINYTTIFYEIHFHESKVIKNNQIKKLTINKDEWAMQ